MKIICSNCDGTYESSNEEQAYGGAHLCPKCWRERMGVYDDRFVDSDDPRAVLRAWGGDEGTIDMGGWTDDDGEAFEEVIRIELKRQGLHAPSRIVIERISAEDKEKEEKDEMKQLNEDYSLFSFQDEILGDEDDNDDE